MKLRTPLPVLGLLCTIICMSFHRTHGIFGIDEVDDIFAISKYVLEHIGEIWDAFTEAKEGELPDLNIFHRSRKNQMYIMRGIENITQYVRHIDDTFPQLTAMVLKHIDELPDLIKYNDEMKELNKYMREIESYYDSFLDFSKEDGFLKYNKYSRVEFAKSVVSPSVTKNLEYLHLQLVPSSNSLLAPRDSIFKLISTYFGKQGTSHCSTLQSTQQLLFNYYNYLRILQLKGFVMMQFSYMILLNLKEAEGDFTLESQRDKDVFLKRFSQQVETVKLIMSESENSFLRCDPKVHKVIETYTTVTGLLQGFLINERNMKENSADCREDCSYYQIAKERRCDPDDSYCRYTRSCAGNIYNCKVVTQNAISVCPSDRDSSRRYEWLDFSGTKYGPVSDRCWKTTNTAKMWKSWFKIFYPCDYCFCYCDDMSGKYHRYVSLLPSVSNVAENKIVVGVRFIKKDNVIHLQAREGTLLPKGVVANESIAWVPLPNLWDETLNEKSDKIYVLKYESRAIDLDDLTGENDSLLTGVKFRQLGSHLNLEINVTPFDFETGKLKPDHSHWIQNDATDLSDEDRRKFGDSFPPEYRKEFQMASTNVPIMKNAPPSTLDSETNQFLYFTHSDDENDAAQSTVPFFDAQAVEPTPHIPLVGMGIAHKGSKQTAGFLAPKVFTYNLGSHLNATAVQQIILKGGK